MKATEPRVTLTASLPKFSGRYHDLVNRYGISVTYKNRICNKSNTACATSVAETAYSATTLH